MGIRVAYGAASLVATDTLTHPRPGFKPFLH
jgi:hypothetical protein